MVAPAALVVVLHGVKVTKHQRFDFLSSIIDFAKQTRKLTIDAFVLVLLTWLIHHSESIVCLVGGYVCFSFSFPFLLLESSRLGFWACLGRGLVIYECYAERRMFRSIAYYVDLFGMLCSTLCQLSSWFTAYYSICLRVLRPF